MICFRVWSTLSTKQFYRIHKTARLSVSDCYRFFFFPDLMFVWTQHNILGEKCGFFRVFSNKNHHIIICQSFVFSFYIFTSSETGRGGFFRRREIYRQKWKPEQGWNKSNQRFLVLLWRNIFSLQLWTLNL